VLTDLDTEVPEGHYADDNMKQTVVPNRNMVMLSMAAGIAISNNCTGLVTGVHAGDHDVYPDCRPEFIEALNKTLLVANAGFVSDGFGVHAPFMNMHKSQIVTLGAELGVPFEKTWSCYKGGDIHCGRCSTCVERIEAFQLAHVDDPTEYEDNDFWKTVI
jgi:7-cyano-7-deazaguanine synthase